MSLVYSATTFSMQMSEPEKMFPDPLPDPIITLHETAMADQRMDSLLDAMDDWYQQQKEEEKLREDEWLRRGEQAKEENRRQAEEYRRRDPVFIPEPERVAQPDPERRTEHKTQGLSPLLLFQCVVFMC
jgi:hypothetical protein